MDIIKNYADNTIDVIKYYRQKLKKGADPFYRVSHHDLFPSKELYSSFYTNEKFLEVITYILEKSCKIPPVYYNYDEEEDTYLDLFSYFVAQLAINYLLSLGWSYVPSYLKYCVASKVDLPKLNDAELEILHTENIQKKINDIVKIFDILEEKLSAEERYVYLKQLFLIKNYIINLIEFNKVSHVPTKNISELKYSWYTENSYNPSKKIILELSLEEFRLPTKITIISNIIKEYATEYDMIVNSSIKDKDALNITLNHVNNRMSFITITLQKVNNVINLKVVSVAALDNHKHLYRKLIDNLL